MTTQGAPAPTAATAAAASANAKLILLTMVKNESRIIERLMASVKGRADAIIVCDTGSTDNTVELVRRYLATNEIPGTVYEYPFKNFGASRSKSFECCQDWVQKMGWDATSTWALLLDGDMLLSSPLDRKAVAALPEAVAGISLKQSNGGLLYSNMRVLRCSEPWVCKGATHEAWTCPQSKQTTLFESPVLTDYGDGGCKADKYERDVRLLKEDLSGNENDCRTNFYLGQTYLCLRDWAKAIPTLQKRVDLGGWDEENYIARVYLGECYENSGKPGEAMRVWLEAWQYRQHRTEAPIKLICMLRKQPRSQFLAGMFLEKFFAIQFGENLATGEAAGTGKATNNQDILFVNKRDINFQLWEELGILAFYTGLQRPAWLRTDALDLTGHLGWHDFNTLFSQMHWYDWCFKPRKQTRFQLPLTTLPWGAEPEADAWQPFNPSIRAKSDKSGYIVNLRYANYYTAEAKHYAYRAFHGQVLTRNCLMEVPAGTDWNSPSRVEEIKIDSKYKQDEANYIKGVEDCRLAQGTDALEYMGTSRSYSNNGSNKIFHVWRGDEETTWHLKQLPLPPGVSPEETQKNWLPFRHKGDLLYIYSFSPFKICDSEGNVRVEVDTASNSLALSLHEYRGSAGPAAWTSAAHPDEAYLCVMHKVYIGGDGRRYYHRFMTLDSDLKPSRVSCWTRFTKERVEYWSGITPSLEGDSFLITYGTRDSEAYIAELKTEDIEATLFYDLKAQKALPFKERLAKLAAF